MQAISTDLRYLSSTLSILDSLGLLITDNNLAELRPRYYNERTVPYTLIARPITYYDSILEYYLFLATDNRV